jgi:hypothetical protein
LIALLPNDIVDTSKDGACPVDVISPPVVFLVAVDAPPLSQKFVTNGCLGVACVIGATCCLGVVVGAGGGVVWFAIIFLALLAIHDTACSVLVLFAVGAGGTTGVGVGGTETAVDGISIPLLCLISCILCDNAIDYSLLDKDDIFVSISVVSSHNASIASFLVMSASASLIFASFVSSAVCSIGSSTAGCSTSTTSLSTIIASQDCSFLKSSIVIEKTSAHLDERSCHTTYCQFRIDTIIRLLFWINNMVCLLAIANTLF